MNKKNIAFSSEYLRTSFICKLSLTLLHNKRLCACSTFEKKTCLRRSLILNVAYNFDAYPKNTERFLCRIYGKRLLYPHTNLLTEF